MRISRPRMPSSTCRTEPTCSTASISASLSAQMEARTSFRSPRSRVAVQLIFLMRAASSTQEEHSVAIQNSRRFCYCQPSSPTAVRSAFGAGEVRSALDVSDARLRLIDRGGGVVHNRLPRLGGISEGIFGEAMQVSCIDQVGQALRRLVFVLRVLVDGFPHIVQIFL